MRLVRPTLTDQELAIVKTKVPHGRCSPTMHLKKPHEIFYTITTAPERRRRLLTPVGLAIFTALMLSVVYGGVITDRALNMTPLLPGAAGVLVGASLVALGIPLWAWCLVLFWNAKGTAVPFNPPRELVVAGPYAWVRNPMLTGVFASLFGFGFILHSAAMVLLWTPAFLMFNLISVKVLEEPELELRFGASYREYRQRVPMLLPRRLRSRKRDAR
jgi:protein-S-isoprenylcysteine O-methyltransferase Ste14